MGEIVTRALAPGSNLKKCPSCSSILGPVMKNCGSCGWTSIITEALSARDRLQWLGVDNKLSMLLERLVSHISTLRRSIVEHRRQPADDRCYEDDIILYAVLNDGVVPDFRVGDKKAMLHNCERFIENRCQGGSWATYSEMQDHVFWVSRLHHVWMEHDQDIETCGAAACTKMRKLLGIEGHGHRWDDAATTTNAQAGS